jgi:hypothetical protein
MKNLDWAEAELVIQPPDGRTLVNLKTNFYTTTTGPTSQTIPLLGQKVEIEATPAEYTWHFGDGETRSGSDPGAAYPDLRITHVYLEAGVTVSPSVDVTYQGQYRVNGGNWIAIPQTPHGPRDTGEAPGTLGDPAPRRLTSARTGWIRSTRQIGSTQLSAGTRCFNQGWQKYPARVSHSTRGRCLHAECQQSEDQARQKWLVGQEWPLSVSHNAGLKRRTAEDISDAEGIDA